MPERLINQLSDHDRKALLNLLTRRFIKGAAITAIIISLVIASLLSIATVVIVNNNSHYLAEKNALTLHADNCHKILDIRDVLVTIVSQERIAPGFHLTKEQTQYYDQQRTKTVNELDAISC